MSSSDCTLLEESLSTTAAAAAAAGSSLPIQGGFNLLFNKRDTSSCVVVLCLKSGELALTYEQNFFPIQMKGVGFRV
jgi:hypothetical protein